MSLMLQVLQKWRAVFDSWFISKSCWQYGLCSSLRNLGAGSRPPKCCTHFVKNLCHGQFFAAQNGVEETMISGTARHQTARLVVPWCAEGNTKVWRARQTCFSTLAQHGTSSWYFTQTNLWENLAQEVTESCTFFYFKDFVGFHYIDATGVSGFA